MFDGTLALISAVKVVLVFDAALMCYDGTGIASNGGEGHQTKALVTRYACAPQGIYTGVSFKCVLALHATWTDMIVATL